ncbi:sulfite exporter TauE/SafE family protein [Lacticaseibacillus daqingensis]|uniref:sulfite exporter TauE/SafE family protein n=1 Tax=Lacticaseibacillus daqingensis TaxID=2486014 RepID=UPI000F7B1AE2|nr:sulfite exporter TauE/SafE family protein [Lacticaseibacillus daqingensis]
MKGLLYVVVIVCANTIGAISGMGGGVIIKPALQLFDLDPVVLINFYSSVAVFTMAISATTKQLRAHNHIDLSTAAWLSLGSVAGGALGDYSFARFNAVVGDAVSVVCQMVLVILSLLLSLWLASGHVAALNRRGWPLMLLAGLALGWLATVLGIGGGPINIACFLFVFGLGIRQATIYSIITIFFSQGAKLIQALLSGSVTQVSGPLIGGIILAALVGGWLGANISNKVPEKHILLLYNLVIWGVLLLDVANLIGVLI